jgi:hypothetical protein
MRNERRQGAAIRCQSRLGSDDQGTVVGGPPSGSSRDACELSSALNVRIFDESGAHAHQSPIGMIASTAYGVANGPSVLGPAT